MVFKNLTLQTAFSALLVFLLPFQTRFLFPFPESVALRGDLTVFSLYAVEVLVLFGIFVYGFRLELQRRAVPWILGGFGFVLLSFTSALWSSVPLASVHFALHLFLAILLLVLLTDERVNRRVVLQAFIIGLIPPVLFGIAQVVLGSFPASTILGIAERSAQTLGDSVVLFGDARILRAYGTFSHPNMFGGVLATTLLALIIFPVFEKRARTLLGLLLGLGLALTFSQGAWIAFVVGLLSYYFRATKKHAVAFVAFCLFLSLCFIAISPTLSVSAPASISERILQAEAGLQILKQTPVLGAGAGNYLHELYAQFPGNPWYAYQPVHNAYLLLLLELGIGILPFFLLFRYRAMRYPAFFFTLATLALFDHYLLTQWSGLTLFVFVLALLDSEC